MSEIVPLWARLNDGRELPANACNCARCRNEWFMCGLSDEWLPSYCPYCGLKFVYRETDGEPDEYQPRDAIEDVAEQRDAAEDAADTMASLILGEPIDWPFHDAAWQRAIDSLS